MRSNKTKDYNLTDWHSIFMEDIGSPTGLRWKISPTKGIKAGDVAGSIGRDKESYWQYFRVQYDKTSWYIHRIIWVMRNGNIDFNLDIDHIDGNSLNNSIENLRLVHKAVNSRNQKQQKNNSSGVTGVGFWTTGGYTYVRVRWCNLSGKLESKFFPCKKLGLLEAFAAACAYREEKIKELNEQGAEYSERHGT